MSKSWPASQSSLPVQEIKDMIARLERRIGVNYVQTEENAGAC